MWSAVRNINIGVRLHSIRILKRFEFRRNLADSGYKCAELNNKKLIVVKGKDTFPFLQGMITNDARHLYVNDEASVHLNCMFSFLLHFNGRVFVDLMMYTFDDSSKETTKKVLSQREGKDDDTVFVECDSTLSEEVFSCFKTHKLRKKVDISFDKNYSVYTVFPNVNEVGENLTLDPLSENKTESCLLVKDPRLSILGYRLLKQRSEGIEILSKIAKKPIVSSTIDDYCEYRYKLGVGEGVVDHPSGSCFPLECNADFLHGVSFHKGCYIGQELTARIYHTGVIRKRLMPFQILDANKCDTLQSNDIILSNDKNKSKLGKLRSKHGLYGLALLNVEEAAKCGFSVLCKDVELKVKKPHWWPKEEQRDQIPCGRADHEVMQINGAKHCNY